MAIQPRFRVYNYFHIYWSNFKILFYACVVEGCSASLTIAREKQTSNLFHLRWSSVENRVSRDVLTGKVYYGYASTGGELIEVTEYFLNYLSKYIARDTNQDRKIKVFLCHFFISAGIMFSELTFILTNAQKCSGERIYVYFLWE